MSDGAPDDVTSFPHVIEKNLITLGAQPLFDTSGKYVIFPNHWFSFSLSYCWYSCTSHLFKFFSSFLPTDSLQVYKNMCGSLVRRWRSAVPFSGGAHTHTHTTHLWRERRQEKGTKKAVCGRVDAWLMNDGFPPTRRNPPECSAPPDLVAAQPAPFQNGASLMVIYPSLLFPPILDGIPNPQTYTLWSYRYMKIVSVFKFYLAEKCYQSIPSYYYFILSLRRLPDSLSSDFLRLF